jgi:hypothetical protein
LTLTSRWSRIPFFELRRSSDDLESVRLIEFKLVSSESIYVQVRGDYGRYSLIISTATASDPPSNILNAF